MDKKKEKAFDEKIKRFNEWTFGIFVNIGVSMLTTLILLEKLGVFK